MTNFATATESLISDALGFSYESAAMQTAMVLKLNNNRLRAPLDSTLIKLGLESTTGIATHISEEGVFDWIKGKLSALGRKINVVVNKLYAKLTRADDATKDLIRKASTDSSIELPISGAKASAIIAATAAVITAVGVLAANIFGKSDEEKLKIASERLKALKEAVRDGVLAKDGSIITKYARRTVAKAMRKDAKTIARLEEKLTNPNTKTFLQKMSGYMAALRKHIGNFASKFRSAESSAASEAKSHDGDEKVKVSLWERLKNVGKNIASLFGIVRKWFAAIPGIFKRGKKEAEA